MLLELHVCDLALIEDVWLEFGPGLTVLTGETGAGKTVLVSALKLLLGERADSGMVRQGADEAVVEGRFLLDGAEVVVRRRLSAEGRSRCTIDGEMATVAMLGQLLGPVVDLHGQHEHQALLTPSRHAGYLDRFIGGPAESAMRAYRDAWERRRQAQARLDDITSALADRERRIDYLRFVIEDIDAVAPRAGEDAELGEALPRLRYGERLAEAAEGAWVALRDEAGASDRLTAAVSALVAVRGLDPALDALAEDVARLDVELQEVASSVRAYAESIDHDAGALDATEQRLHLLEGLTRKYGPSLEDVLSARIAAVEELAVLDAGEEAIAGASAEVQSAGEQLKAAAGSLVEARETSVAAFADALQRAAADLALPNAAFAVSRTPLPFESWTLDGPEQLEFLFAGGAGEAPRPLAKIASGGEVSRVMLALKGVLGHADAVPVLVFDEVDAGIGGATALSVGERLASLTKRHQVLVITHLAQVAVYADAHVVVAKSERDGRSVTGVRPVRDDDRVKEIARMLSGGSSETGLAHARELIAVASGTATAEG